MATKKAAKKAAKPAPKKAAEAKSNTTDTSAKSSESITGAQSEQVALPAGKGTQNTAPPPSNPPPLERGTRSKNNPGIIKSDDAEDTVRRQKDKARWSYGETNADSTATLMKEQREIDAASKDE